MQRSPLGMGVPWGCTNVFMYLSHFAFEIERVPPPHPKNGSQFAEDTLKSMLLIIIAHLVSKYSTCIHFGGKEIEKNRFQVLFTNPFCP